MCKGKQLWDSSCGGHPDPTFILLQWEEWFIISRPKIGFWVNTCHIVQSLRKSQAPILPVRDPPSSVGQLPYAITWQPETNLTLRSPPPHSACCAVGSLSIDVIISSIFLIRLLLHPLLGTPTSWCIQPPLPAFFFITDDILPVKRIKLSCSGSISFLFLGQLSGISVHKQAS